jgi:hypothetical protein
MDRDLGKPRTSQASTKIRAASGHACINAEWTLSFPYRAKPDDCRKPGWRLPADGLRQTDLITKRTGRCRLTSRFAKLPAIKAHDKDGTFKKEFYR